MPMLIGEFLRVLTLKLCFVLLLTKTHNANERALCLSESESNGEKHRCSFEHT